VEKYLLPILEEGGIWGALVVLALLLTLFLLRNKKLILGDKAPVVSTSQISELSARVGAVEARLGEVENDLSHLPTREELHELRVQHAVQAERIAGLERTTSATNAAVQCIESYLINLSREAKK
jgi:hypothetical protein